MVRNNAFSANVHLAVFAEILNLFLRVFHTEFLRYMVLSLRVIYGVLVLVEKVKDCEVFYQLLDVRRKVLAAGGAGKDAGSPEVHEAALAEGVTTLEDTRDLVLLVVVVVANGARYLHNLIINCGVLGFWGAIRKVNVLRSVTYCYMKETIDEISDMAKRNLPVSIIIIGVGNEDFSNMVRLDGDDLAI